jgi:hypothetical protein
MGGNASHNSCCGARLLLLRALLLVLIVNMASASDPTAVAAQAEKSLTAEPLQQVRTATE